VESICVSTGAQNNLRKKLLTSAGIEWNVSFLHRRVTGFKTREFCWKTKRQPENNTGGTTRLWKMHMGNTMAGDGLPPISCIFPALP
ncbi:hypothetical protein K0M31_011077, partial [Melipona bicolor]